MYIVHKLMVTNFTLKNNISSMFNKYDRACLSIFGFDWQIDKQTHLKSSFTFRGTKDKYFTPLYMN